MQATNEGRSRHECPDLGVIATGPPHEVVLAGYSGAYQIVVSLPTLTEFQETLQKYPERFGMDDEEIQAEVETLRYFGEFVEPEEALDVVGDDPDDDKFFEAAVAGNVDYIVSGDQHLLDVGSFRGIDVVPPRPFHDRLS